MQMVNAAQSKAGLLVFVVGGSGVGKDSLLIGARNELAGDTQIHFPKRMITRDAVVDLEDHDTVSFDEYARKVSVGDAALNWQAHGLGYIIPSSIKKHLSAGNAVVCNVSRTIIKEAAEKYPVHIINIVADIQLRAKRLSGRGRETEQEIASRLARNPILLPKGVPVSEIENNQSLEQGVASITSLLRELSVHAHR